MGKHCDSYYQINRWRDSVKGSPLVMELTEHPVGREIEVDLRGGETMPYTI